MVSARSIEDDGDGGYHVEKMLGKQCLLSIASLRIHHAFAEPVWLDRAARSAPSSTFRARPAGPAVSMPVGPADSAVSTYLK